MNRDFWEQWNINIAFMRLELHTKDHFQLRARIMPVATFYTIGVALQNNFELKRSLQIGQMVFSSNSPLFDSTNSIGVAYAGLMVIKDGYMNDYSLLSHEIVHLFQQNDATVFNTYGNKINTHLFNQYKPMKSIFKYTYFDFHYYLIVGIHLIENKSRVNYYDNFLEHEAGYFSNTLF